MMTTDTLAPISFDHTENAFAYKTDAELKKAHWLFKLMSYPILVSAGVRITPWAIRTGLPVTGIIRNTLFPQFVGGETLRDTAPVAHKLGQYRVQVILDYGVEGGASGEEGFDQAAEEFLHVIDYAATQPNIPFMSVKVTGIARFSLLEQLDHSVETNSGTLMKRYQQAVASLSAAESQEWQRVIGRLDRICARGYEKNVGVFIDAEDSWIQDPVDMATILMMEKYNRERAVVYNTYQLYRHDRLAFLKDSHEAAVQRHFILGAKLVRGAYLEKERLRAQERNYPSPIQPDKEHTDNDYNEAVRFCMDHLDRVALVVASHNEYSSLLTTRLMSERGVPSHHPHVHFSQLYGMSDNITFNLAKAGFSVSKYLPFGPLKDVIPYLMRRAQENSSVAGQTGRELALIRRELARRGL